MKLKTNLKLITLDLKSIKLEPVVLSIEEYKEPQKQTIQVLSKPKKQVVQDTEQLF